jgi:hypothetical protein
VVTTSAPVEAVESEEKSSVIEKEPEPPVEYSQLLESTDSSVVDEVAVSAEVSSRSASRSIKISPSSLSSVVLDEVSAVVSS